MDIYLIIVVVLFILAISDLIVGVGNDAVNFLNSAVGSKVAPRHIILIVASFGVFIGATFSSGIMEVARKGIFNPDQFFFPEVMTIFLAVMLTDIMLLDLYNTFSLPTSTTVSIVFELLGASVGLSLIKISQASDSIAELVRYINTDKALAIISGILISVGVAFTVGAIVQYIIRLLFTFDYEKTIRKFGAIWGSISLTSITYFILVKGAKGSSFISPEVSTWIVNNADIIFLYSIAGWYIIFQFLIWFTKINILKPIVLVGTFALALAFAGNDLVNFIGVPLAGYHSYQIALESGDSSALLMSELLKPVNTETIILLIAGLVMVLTIWYSKKARSVTKTEVNLGRQFEGYERFESSPLARMIVRMSISLGDSVKKIIPKSILSFLNRRMDNLKAPDQKLKPKERPAFDLIRASVNLMISSILISFATSLKLPLSTTYVTFMVAMGTSFSDKSWGRESAVFRVNGVITVIGGWFLTAFLAFTVSFVFTFLIYYGNLVAVIALMLLALFFVYKTHLIHDDRAKLEEESEKELAEMSGAQSETIAFKIKQLTKFLDSTLDVVEKSINGLDTTDRKAMKKSIKESEKLDKRASNIVTNIFNTLKSNKDEIKDGHQFGKIVSDLVEVNNNVQLFSRRVYEHIDNNHKKPLPEQIVELQELSKAIKDQVKLSNSSLQQMKFDQMKELEGLYKEFQKKRKKFDKNQITRVKKNTVSIRNNILYLALTSDLANISAHLQELLLSVNETLSD